MEEGAMRLKRNTNALTNASPNGSRVLAVGTLMLVAVAILALAVVTATAACGGLGPVGDAGTVSTADETRTTVTVPVAENEATTTTAAGAEGSNRETATTSSSDTPVADTMRLQVYYTRGEGVFAVSRVLPKSDRVGAAAMKALLQGPTAEEKAAGITTNIPKGSTFLGLSIKDGIATVDLSQEYASGGGSFSMAMRLAQVVFTLTQFPTVDGVMFKLDGKPVEVFGGEGLILDHAVGRSDYEDMAPSILVESPTFGETVRSPVRITGTANVFEATFKIQIADPDGAIVAEETVMATSGSGTRGTFDVKIPYAIPNSGLGAIIVYYESPKDGTPEDVVEIPVSLMR
jgi:spore germination protein GerM